MTKIEQKTKRNIVRKKCYRREGQEQQSSKISIKRDHTAREKVVNERTEIRNRKRNEQKTKQGGDQRRHDTNNHYQ